jgi:hypothetical protein
MFVETERISSFCLEIEEKLDDISCFSFQFFVSWENCCSLPCHPTSRHGINCTDLGGSDSCLCCCCRQFSDVWFILFGEGRNSTTQIVQCALKLMHCFVAEYFINSRNDVYFILNSVSLFYKATG